MKTAGGHEYRLYDRVRDDETARRGFLDLARRVFQLDFEPWREGGWWGADYIPHLLMDGDRAAANVSANLIRTSWRGEEKRFLQIGTVMTDPAYRGQGLARRLMELVLQKYEGASDGAYLYANDSVLDFYPKFGFAPAVEHQCRLSVRRSGAAVRRMNMADERDRRLLLDAYRSRGNPRAALPVVGNTGLLMFYCAGFMKDCVYEIPALGAVAVAEYEGEAMRLFDAFGGGAPLPEILSALAKEGTRFADLGFTPKDAAGCAVSPRREADTTLFVKGGLGPMFSGNRLMFPLLSHA